MRRLTAAVTALVCGVSVAVAAPGAHASGHAQGWVIIRTGRGPAVLKGKFTGHAGGATATAVLFALRGHGATRKLDGKFTTGRVDWGADGAPRVYGGMQPACAAACTDPGSTPAGYYFSSNDHPMDSPVYIATWDVVDVTIDLTVAGWRVRRWLPSMRTVPTESAGDVGARALHTSAGRFTGAEAPGGRYGSLGWAALPCNTYGSGSARLTGGVRAWPLDCEILWVMADSAAVPTRWRLSGNATGVGAIVNVLVVVDYPPG